MDLEAHPRFVAESRYSLSTDDRVRLVSEDSVLQREIWLRDCLSGQTSRQNDRFINGLSGNTRVRKVHLCLNCLIDSEESFRSLVDWLDWRGDKCELHLDIYPPCRPPSLSLDLQQVRTLMERRASILSSSATNLNLKTVSFSRATDSNLSDALMRNIFSLVTADAKVVLDSMSERTIRRLFPHFVQGITTFEYFEGVRGRPMDIHGLFESTLSQRNIREYSLRLQLLAEEDDPVFFGLMDCLNRYQRQDGGGGTLTKLSLSFAAKPVAVRRLATALERIPFGFPVELCLELGSHFGAHETETLLESLRTLPSLTHLDLHGCISTDVDLSQWVNIIEGLFHGQLHSFRLSAEIPTAHCFTRSLHSSDIQVLHFGHLINSTNNELVDFTHALADVLPTMARLKDFRFFDGRDRQPEFEGRISNEQEHEKYLTTSTSVHLPIYIAYDALYTAVCDHSPSITTCELPGFTEWHRDRLGFALKTRTICVEKLVLSVSNETAPLSLLPLALSRLSEGHWYDVMAYIIRQKSDLLIAPSSTASLFE